MPRPTKSGSLNKIKNLPDFAPSDPLDGRELLEWESKYQDPKANRAIRVEAIYLSSLLFIVPAFILALWLEYPKKFLRASDVQYQSVLKYGLAWLSGTLGGILFDLKWLYHSVARQAWHLDRRLWRLLTPHISGGLAFAVIALIASGMFKVFDQRSVDSHSLVVGVAFLVGYFSDSAIAKLSEIAETLFGAARGKEKHKERLKSDAHTSTENNKDKKTLTNKAENGSSLRDEASNAEQENAVQA
jgi:hypothetical protein